MATARENIETKTYTFTVRWANFAEHTLRGAAYTKHHFAFEIPYKIYYTRDGGKTSQVVYEGVSPGADGPSFQEFEVELPADAFYSNDAGFYISAEAEIDGQRMVTSDLRTDGRAYPTLVCGYEWTDDYTMEISLTPPTGEKAKFTLDGAVGYYKENETKLTSVGEGFAVSLYLKNGQLVAETKTDAKGRFSLDCEVDAIDNGFGAESRGKTARPS